MSKDKIKGIIYAIVSSGTFGLIPLFSIPLMTEAKMQETSILTYRYFFSAIALFILCIFCNNSLKVSLKTLIKLFFISFSYAATAVALIYSYNYIPSGVATTIHFMYPIVVVFLMSFFYKEKLSVKIILISLFALAGVSFLSFTGENVINIKGLLIALSTVFTYAIYIVGLNTKGVNQLDSKVVTFYVLLFGAIIFGLISQLTTGLNSIPNVNAWINVLMLALFPTVISLLSLVKAVKYVGSTTSSILGAVEPLVAMLVGMIIFYESFTVYSLIGFVFIIISVSYIVLYMRNK